MAQCSVLASDWPLAMLLCRWKVSSLPHPLRWVYAPPPLGENARLSSPQPGKATIPRWTTSAFGSCSATAASTPPRARTPAGSSTSPSPSAGSSSPSGRGLFPLSAGVAGKRGGAEATVCLLLTPPRCLRAFHENLPPPQS